MQKILINRKKAVKYSLEINLGGRSGIRKGPGSGEYTDLDEVMRLAYQAKADGLGVVVIARNKDGAGRAMVLGLVDWYKA